MDRGSSKRVRGNARSETAAATTKKKAKEAVTKTEEVEEEVVVEERKEGEGLSVAEEEASAAAAADGVDALWSGVDEGMPWATCWFPFWEVEASLYGDVWDYDIWGLKATNNVPPNH